MKKIIVVLLIVATLALAVGQLAFAATADEQSICEIATSNEKVTDAKCVIYERTCIIAIKTEKFTTKTQYDKYVNDLTDQVKSEFEVDHVFVTRNPKVMKQIESLSKVSQDQRDEAIRQLIQDVMRHKPPRKLVNPPIV